MKIDAYIVEETNAPFSRDTVELADPVPGEVLVRNLAVGVCHTDMNTQAGNMPYELPGILGHEGAGVIEAVGDGVTDFAIGDRVVLGWPYCGACRNCIAGEHRYCLHIGEALVGGHRLREPGAGTSGYSRDDGKPINGHFFGQSSFATHSLVHASSLVKVDSEVDLALAAPLGCGITTGAGAVFNSVRPEPGAAIVVIGAGAVGLGAIMAAVNTPATTIIAADLSDDRLRLAHELGATHIINSGNTNLVEEILKICPNGADAVLDCTGVIGVIEQAAEAVAMLGSLVLIGGAPAEASFRLDHFRTLWGQRVIGVLGGGSTSTQLIPTILELHRQGRFPLEKLVKTYAFDDLEQAIADTSAGTTVKAVLELDQG
ncbi:NAD(P)-dependent alcohol dehydrogenase [Micrococcoides hystricis]|uniref:NAD(P)-dependent alcohol dehydrogenase n=1 Tax=Micrococcoides hystricis TaxID=1572761 RepID=A0ABV6PAZ6_9MICC